MPYDLKTDGFWRKEDLRAELLRVSEVCSGCRLCLDFCPSFPSLFEAIDTSHEGAVSKITDGEFRRVVDLCFQCKRCYVNCPYTPDQGHPHQVDFPRLLLRERMVRAKAEGIAWGDRFLGNPDLTGALGGLTAPLSNRVMRSRLVRRLLEKATGVDRRRDLPPFHRTSFDRWFRKQEKRLNRKVGGKGGKVALFIICSVNYNYPEIGKSLVAVLAHHDIKVVVPEQRCCGMPYLDRGDLANAMENLRFNVRSFRRFVDQGYTVVVPQATCGYVLKKEYPWLDDGADSRALSRATMDAGEYLMGLHERGKLKSPLVRRREKVVYHFPCHLKAQNIGCRSRDLLEQIPGTVVEMLDRCTGMDGTWGMKREHFDESLRVARQLFRAIEDTHPDRVASDCALACLQLGQGTGMRAVHPVELLREAYGLRLEVD
jgi:glycerol-3-phosphate dehydrogenase subunit C